MNLGYWSSAGCGAFKENILVSGGVAMTSGPPLLVLPPKLSNWLDTVVDFVFEQPGVACWLSK